MLKGEEYMEDGIPNKSLKHLKNKKENTIKISAQSYLKKFYFHTALFQIGDEYLYAKESA